MRQLILNRLSYFFFNFGLLGLIFLEPYGLSVGNTNLRFSDFLLLILGLFSCQMLFYKGRLHGGKSLQTVLLLFFVGFELFLPFIGVFFFSDIGAVSSSFRALLCWGIPIFFFLNFHGDWKKLLLSFERLLKVGLLINLGVSILQLLVFYGVLSSDFDLKSYFSYFSIYERFERVNSIASGLFLNSTALALFAFTAFVFFWTKMIVEKRFNNFLYLGLSIFVIFLAVSRTMVLAVLIIIIFSTPLLGLKKSFFSAIFVIAFLIGGFFAIFALGYNIEQSFQRFTRLEAGLDSDYSFMTRYTVLWPKALKMLEKYPYGTLTNPVSFIGTIDSGYLTYYGQGGWPFLMLVIFLFASFFSGGCRAFLEKKYNFFGLFIFFMGIFLAGSMIVMIPLRNSYLAFVTTFMLFGKARNYD